MVLVEAAAITACGVAAYKGGKEATVATIKAVKTKLKLTTKEQANRERCEQRKEERRERFAKVNEYRSSIAGGGIASSFNWDSGCSDQKKPSTTSASRRRR